MPGNHHPLHGVSILVVVDRPLRRDCGAALWRAGSRVSILVVVDRPLRQPLRFRLATREDVSILVVVDRPLRRRSGFTRKPVAPCFNPCCRGSPSSTLRNDWAISPKARFQSLLSWIALFDPARASCPMSSTPGFNPCCRGSPSSTTKEQYARMPEVFVSNLLSWIALFDNETVSNPKTEVSVSILVVVDRPSRRPKRPNPRLLQTVSVPILVVVDRPLRPWRSPAK